MVCTKDYGFRVEDIDWATPIDIEPYIDAYDFQRRQNDELLWVMGQYVCHAISLIGKGTYPSKPLLESSYKANNEYEIEKQRKEFIAKFEVMASNWKRSNNSSNKE